MASEWRYIDDPSEAPEGAEVEETPIADRYRYQAEGSTQQQDDIETVDFNQADLDGVEQSVETFVQQWKEQSGNNVEVEDIYAFGSAVRGEAEAGRSDLDLMLVTTNPEGSQMEPSFDVGRRDLEGYLHERGQEIVDSGNLQELDGVDIVTEIPRNEDVRLNDKLQRPEGSYSAVNVRTGERIETDKASKQDDLVQVNNVHEAPDDRVVYHDEDIGLYYFRDDNIPTDQPAEPGVQAEEDVERHGEASSADSQRVQPPNAEDVGRDIFSLDNGHALVGEEAQGEHHDVEEGTVWCQNEDEQYRGAFTDEEGKCPYCGWRLLEQDEDLSRTSKGHVIKYWRYIDDPSKAPDWADVEERPTSEAGYRYNTEGKPAEQDEGDEEGEDAGEQPEDGEQDVVEVGGQEFTDVALSTEEELLNEIESGDQIAVDYRGEEKIAEVEEVKDYDWGTMVHAEGPDGLITIDISQNPERREERGQDIIGVDPSSQDESEEPDEEEEGDTDGGEERHFESFPEADSRMFDVPRKRGAFDRETSEKYRKKFEDTVSDLTEDGHLRDVRRVEIRDGDDMEVNGTFECEVGPRERRIKGDIVINEMYSKHDVWGGSGFMEEESLEETFRTNGKSTKEPMHTLVHEIAHASHLGGRDRESYESVYNMSFTSEEEEIAKEHVSDYAATKPIEFVAEVFVMKWANAQVGEEKYEVTEEVQELYDKLEGPSL